VSKEKENENNKTCSFFLLFVTDTILVIFLGSFPYDFVCDYFSKCLFNLILCLQKHGAIVLIINIQYYFDQKYLY